MLWKRILITLVTWPVICCLNESEYNKMPPLFALDPYESCLLDPAGVYCVLDVDLFAKNQSSLMNMIHEYSSNAVKHFNHTQIHRGVCVTTACRNFIHNHNLSTAKNLNMILEECINDSLWRNYEIQGKISKILYCKRQSDELDIDGYDLAVAVIIIVLIVLNIAGSLYDVLRAETRVGTGNPYLLAFSIRRNWNKLTASSGGGSEPRLERLKAFHGLRTMTMVCVIFSHTALILSFSYIDNPRYIENSYEDPFKQILFNGSVVVHTFFVMSSFLLAYNFQIHREKHEISWTQLPRGIIMRWLRLTPTYALVLATIATWMRFAGQGPLWDLVVVSEAEACRQYWWTHILYINNYVYDNAFCAPQTWYLAADTQLFCLGLLICIAARSLAARKVVLIVLFVVSLVIVASQTYFQDLDAVVIQSPESYRSLYSQEDTFRLLYIRGHTNISTYILGLSGGFLAYHWQQHEKHLDKFRSHRWLVWTLFPLGVMVIMSGWFFYQDGDPPSAVVVLMFAAFYKPLFQFLVTSLIVACVFKIESTYRGILEWRGFTWTGRVSYSAFLLHTIFQRGLVGSQLVPTHMSDYYVLMILCSTIFLSLLGAGVLWICVEAPFAGLLKAALAHGVTERLRQSTREHSKI